MSTAPKTRDVQLACPSCSSRTLLHQTAQGDDWMPSADAVLTAQGWTKADDGVYACSRTCLRIRNQDNPHQISGEEAERRAVARGGQPVYPRTLEEAAERRRKAGGRVLREPAPAAPVAMPLKGVTELADVRLREQLRRPDAGPRPIAALPTKP